jgi:hypothetical protein
MFFLEEVTNIISFIPDLAASITAHSITGLSRIVNISLGTDFVAGKNLVPSPAIGNIAFEIECFMNYEVTKNIKNLNLKEYL